MADNDQKPQEQKPTEDVKEEPEPEETKSQQPPEAAKEESPQKSAKVSPALEKLIGEIEKLSVLELSQLVKTLEEKFGVSAAPAVAVGTAPAGAAQAAGTEEGAPEQTTFNVILTDSGANKISVIKVVRELVQTLGLKEAKDLVDAPPKQILEGVNKETAQEAKTKLEAAGAKVELK